MKLYLASGYGVMKTKGEEKRMAKMLPHWYRLISFYDLERGNKIRNVLDLKQKGEKK